MNNLYIIKCPKCGQEFLPSEIFVPEAFFGKQTEIFKNPDGTINFYLGEDPDYTETYYCDNCGAKLSIEAKLSFNIDVTEDEFEEEVEYKIEKKTKLKEESLFD